jgi:CRP/FNR family cyclic AMP-dependent transcriptional regulator
LKTRITEQYGLKVPFINAGMAFFATAPLVRAVCSAGGMGMLGSAAMPPDGLQAGSISSQGSAGPSTSRYASRKERWWWCSSGTIRPTTGYRVYGRPAAISGFAPQHIDRLTTCIVTKSVKRGTNIFAKGDPGTSLFAIGAGTVRISVPSVEGKDAVFNVLGTGDIFGEIALLNGHPRTADATAVTDCALYVLERRDFLPLMGKEPELALRLIEILCSRLRRTTEQVEEVMFLDLQSSLAKALMRLLESESDAGGTRERKIAITQKDLGNIIGMSRESTNKQLRLWEERKWVRRERNAVVILAIDPIAKIAEQGAQGA